MLYYEGKNIASTILSHSFEPKRLKSLKLLSKWYSFGFCGKGVAMCVKAFTTCLFHLKSYFNRLHRPIKEIFMNMEPDHVLGRTESDGDHRICPSRQDFGGMGYNMFKSSLNF